jgi:hypothetical protein
MEMMVMVEKYSDEDDRASDEDDRVSDEDEGVSTLLCGCEVSNYFEYQNPHLRVGIYNCND